MGSPTSLTDLGLVGRVREISLLDELANRSKFHGAQFLTVSGEAGIGKTKLVESAMTLRRLSGWSAHVGHCIEYSARPLPFGPVVPLLRSMLLDALPDLDQIVEARRTDLALLLPELRDGATRATLAGDNDRLLDAIGETIKVVAARRPLLLVFEDIHWADGATLDLLASLVRTLNDAPVLIIATERTGTFSETNSIRTWLAELLRFANSHSIDLVGLDREELAAQAELLLGSVPSGELIDELERRTGGNAYFAHELLLASEDDAELPASLVDFVTGRLSRLKPDEARLLGGVAIAGGAIDHDRLAAVVEMDDVEPTVRSLVKRAVLDVQGRGYRFRHELMRESVERSLLPFEREALHRRLAEVIASTQGALTSPGDLANLALHWRGANDPDQSLVAAWQAAQAASSVAAYGTAADMAKHALETWPRVAAPENALDVRREELLIQAAQWLNSCYQGEEAAEYIERALATWAANLAPGRRALLMAHLVPIVHHLGRPHEVADLVASARQLIGDERSDDAALVHNRLSKQAVAQGDIRTAAAAAADAIDIAEECGPSEVLIEATTTMALATGVDGDTAAAVELARRARAQATTEGHVHLVALAHRAEWLVLYFNEFRSEASIKAIEQALSYAERHCGPNRRTAARQDMALAYIQTGRLNDANQILDQLLGEVTDDLRRLTVLQGAAMSRLAAGRVNEAEAFLLDADEIADRYQSAQETGLQACLRSQLRRGQGRLDEALRHVDEALRLQLASDNLSFTRESIIEKIRVVAAAVDRGERNDKALVEVRSLVDGFDGPGIANQACRALMNFELALIDGHASPADADELIRLLGTVGRHPDIALTHLHTAQLLLGERLVDRKLLAHHLRAAFELGASLGLDMVADHARAMAKSTRVDLGDTIDLREPAVTNEAVPFGLTAREREVLELVAEGLTNKVIGDRLFVSPRTVSTHVSNLLAKLGVATRGEAAAIYLRHSAPAESVASS